MTELYRQYYHQACKVFKKYAPVKNDYLVNKDQILLEQFKESFRYFPGVVAIVNFPGQQYLYLSENVQNVLGYNALEFYEMGLSKTVSIFVEDQLEVILNKIFPSIFDFFKCNQLNVPPSDYKFTYTSLMKLSTGEARWFFHQVAVIQTEDGGAPLIGVKFISDINDIKFDNTITFAIAQKDSNGIFQTIHKESILPGKKVELLSDREIDVLRLMMQGKTSKEIAEALFISENTVFNHRKNMLKKMNVKRAGELVKKAIANGIM